MVDAAREARSLTAGARVGDRYEILEPISRGAMGEVYRARSRDGTEVAVKRLLDDRHAVRFEIEADSSLNSPAAGRGVVDFMNDANGRHLVMELVRGPDLARVLSERGAPGLPVGEVIAHAQQVCEALRYVHEQQIVHRDVKPQNLILGESGVVLVDFGVARELGGDSGTRATGTPRFMAPEVFVGEEVSPRSDVYSLAATVWALIAGEPPGYRDTPPLVGRFPGIADGLEATLRQGLETHPERRVASVEAFAAALGSPIGTSTGGAALVESLPGPEEARGLLEAIARTVAGVFEAAAASIALRDPATGELIIVAAWGVGAREVVGVRLVPGMGLAGDVVQSGEGTAVPHCREDPRFAQRIARSLGYVPNTMLVVPLELDDEVVGALSVLDRRDGSPYGPPDIPRLELFAELIVSALVLAR